MDSSRTIHGGHSLGGTLTTMSTLQGDLAEYPLPDLLQFFHATRKNGQLLFEHPQTRKAAGVYFHQGEVVHAFCPPREGEAAIYQLFKWKEGKFAFLKSARAPLRTVNLSLPNLLLEGLRRLDEGSVFDNLPDPATILHIERDSQKIGDVRLTQSEWKLLSLVNGRRTLKEIVELSGRSEHEAAQILYGMLLSGVLTERFDDAFLGVIVMEKIPSEQAPRNRGQPPSILANLVIRECNGVLDLRAIKTKLTCADHDLVEEVRLLLRTYWLRTVRGQDEVRRFF